MHTEVSAPPAGSTSNHQHPKYYIGALIYSDITGTENLGTAFLASSNLIITSASNVYCRKERKYYCSHRFYPSQHILPKPKYPFYIPEMVDGVPTIYVSEGYR